MGACLLFTALLVLACSVSASPIGSSRFCSLHDGGLYCRGYWSMPRPYPSSKQNIITSLDMADNNISILTGNILATLPKITALSITHSQIRQLGSDAFTNQPDLNSIWLSDNLLTSLPLLSFTRARQLFALNLPGNQLTALADGVFQHLTALQFMDLSRNLLQELHKATFQGLGQLQSLNLSFNILAHLPPDVFGCTPALNRLYLQGNPLTSLDVVHPLFCQGVNMPVKKLTVPKSLARTGNCTFKVTNVCTATSCLNGGTCSTELHQCVCPTGIRGAKCETVFANCNQNLFVAPMSAPSGASRNTVLQICERHGGTIPEYAVDQCSRDFYTHASNVYFQGRSFTWYSEDGLDSANQDAFMTAENVGWFADGDYPEALQLAVCAQTPE